MRYVIYACQERIGRREPAIVVRSSDGTEAHYSRVEILGPATVVHSLQEEHNGARVWVETVAELRTI